MTLITKTRARFLAIAIAAAIAGPTAVQAYAAGELIKVQAPHKGRQGPGPERGNERRQPPPDYRRDQQRPDDRRGQMSDDERRALNQDLDKANRELYRRRFPQ